MTWLIGLSLFALALAFALTGNLLPWDQKGYWTTQVVTSLIGAVPMGGRGLARLLVGGEGYGNLTLTRSYALHVLALPAFGLALVLLHVALFRRHGVTPAWSSASSPRPKAAEPFWPRQAACDLAAMLLVLCVVAVIVVARHGVSIEAPADPSSAYVARPEWYFRPLYFLIRLLPARFEVAGTVLAVLVVVAFLLGIPFLDRGSSRQLRARWPWLAMLGVFLAGTLALGFASWLSDARTPAYRAERHKVAEQSQRARALALAGVPAAGGLAVYENDPEVAGRRVFASRCAACHEMGGVGERRAPRLDGWATRRWTIGVMRDPDSAENYGTSGVSGMKPLAAPGEVLAAIAEYLFVQAPGGQIDVGRRARGEVEFTRQECNKCHAMDGHAAGDGPNLGGWGSFDWARAFLRDPGAARFYGKQNRMPRMGERLSDEELDALAHLLANQRRLASSY